MLILATGDIRSSPSTMRKKSCREENWLNVIICNERETNVVEFSILYVYNNSFGILKSLELVGFFNSRQHNKMATVFFS